MATFEKKIWQDRISEHPTRRTLTNVSTGDATLFDVARAEGTVTNPGDAFNASNMNDLEDRIDAVVQEMDENFQAGVDAVYNACVARGVTPASSTPTAIAEAIATMYSQDDYTQYGTTRYNAGRTQGRTDKQSDVHGVVGEVIAKDEYNNLTLRFYIHETGSSSPVLLTIGDLPGIGSYLNVGSKLAFTSPVTIAHSYKGIGTQA